MSFVYISFQVKKQEKNKIQKDGKVGKEKIKKLTRTINDYLRILVQKKEENTTQMI